MYVCKFLLCISWLSILYFRYGDTFTFTFGVIVTLEIISKLRKGIPSVEDIIHTLFSAETSIEHKPPFESSPEDCHLWTQVLRNIFKDLSKSYSVFLSEFQIDQCDNEESSSIIIFSCGHMFTEKYFQRSILSEFHEKLHDLLHQFPNITYLLLHYYKHSINFSSACPYCVFYYFRTIHLQLCSGVPIKPWNP